MFHAKIDSTSKSVMYSLLGVYMITKVCKCNETYPVVGLG